MATDFDKNALVIGGGIKPSTKNTPGDIRTRVNAIADIESIPLPFVGMIFYVEENQTFYVVKSLEGKKVGVINIPDSIIGEYVPLHQGYASIEFVEEMLGEVSTTPGPEGPMGPEGPAGAKGEDGRTPVKGVDYFTEEEIAELRYDDSEVRAMILAEAEERDMAIGRKIAEVINGAPEAMDTLHELAEAIEMHQDVYEAFIQVNNEALANEVAERKEEDEVLKARLEALEMIDHEEFLKEHQDISHLATKEEVEKMHEAKYVIGSVPEGTLVDFREKEIRVMCPEGTEFPKQQVGPGGNSNMYYMSLTSKAPEGAVKLIESDGNKTETIDLEGKNSKVIWLALANNGSYFGKTSSTKKYIGWTYTLKWLDENNKVIESDSFRINLANENCFNAMQPYHGFRVAEKAQLDAKADKTQLEGLATQLFVQEEIAKAQLEESEVDLSAYATVEFVNQEIANIEHPQYDDSEVKERLDVLETLNLETKPYIDKNGMLVLCGCPAVARGVGEEVHVVVRFFNDAEDKFVFTKDEFAKLRICMGYGAEGVGTKRNIVETTLEMYDIDKVYVIDGGSQITGEIGTVNVIAERVNYIHGIQGARAMNGGERNIVHNFNVNVKDVELLNILFCGGNGYSVTWNSNVVINNTSINALHGGGSNGYANSTVIEMNNGVVDTFYGVNRGIVNRYKFILNEGQVKNFWAGCDEGNPVVNAVELELNGGQIDKFQLGVSGESDLNPDIVSGHIMECVVVDGDVSMLEKVFDEVDIDLKDLELRVEGLEDVDHSVFLKAEDIEHLAVKQDMEEALALKANKEVLVQMENNQIKVAKYQVIRNEGGLELFLPETEENFMEIHVFVDQVDGAIEIKNECKWQAEMPELVAGNFYEFIFTKVGTVWLAGCVEYK